eukprot:1739120-Pleurochrysis_carterae.AAC.1
MPDAMHGQNIHATLQHGGALALARRSAQAAGVDHCITFTQGEVCTAPPASLFQKETCPSPSSGRGLLSVWRYGFVFMRSTFDARRLSRALCAAGGRLRARGAAAAG